VTAAAASNWSYVAAGYAVSAVALGAYAVRLVVRRRRLGAERGSEPTP